MQAKLKSVPDFKLHNTETDCVWLLKEIKAITHQFKGQRYRLLSLDLAYTTFYTYRQGPDKLLAEYLQQFHANVEVLEHYGGILGAEPAMAEEIKKCIPKKTTPEELTKIVWDHTLAVAFLHRADQRLFGTLWTDSENQFTHGTDQYPQDLTAAYSLLVNL